MRTIQKLGSSRFRAKALAGRGVAMLWCLVAGAAQAQIQQVEFRAADGTTYQVLSAFALGGGAETLRITSVGGGTAGAGSCAMVGGIPTDPVAAIGGTLSPFQPLHPFASVRRTGILTGIDVSFINFTSVYGGRVTIGDPMGASVNICGNAFDCTAEPNVQTLYTLDSNLGGVPAACVAQNLNAGCDGSNVRDAFAFGVAATGTNPPVCDNPTTAVTVNSTLCGPTPTDGFTLADSEAIVFVYDGGAGAAFAVASGGFGITIDAVNAAGCGPNSIISASGDNDSQPAPPPPTVTPTPGGPCASTPLTGCRSAEKSGLQLSKDGMGGSKDKLLWKWLKGEATTSGDLGNPTTTTTYTVCLYDGSSGGAVVSLPAGSTWQAAGTSGFKLSDPSGTPDGVQKALLKGGDAGKSKILVKGRGANLPDTLIPTLALPVTVQLVNDANSICYESVFAGAVVNETGRFKAKTP